MYSLDLPSKLLNDAVEELAKLPGVGRKTALRLALHLLKQPKQDVERFGKAIITFRNDIKYCSSCNNISDTNVCEVCSSTHRNRTTICVVESVKDVMSIEKTQQYNGLYHVLGGIISPMEGVGPSQLEVDLLCRRVGEGEVKEVLLALNTTMEGETTCYYIHKRLKDFPIEITTLARGVGFGDELEYTDELTLGQSIKNRQPFHP